MNSLGKISEGRRKTQFKEEGAKTSISTVRKEGKKETLSIFTEKEQDSLTPSGETSKKKHQPHMPSRGKFKKRKRNSTKLKEPIKFKSLEDRKKDDWTRGEISDCSIDGKKGFPKILLSAEKT